MLWPMATTDYLRRTGGVPAAGWRRAKQLVDPHLLGIHILPKFADNPRVIAPATPQRIVLG
jgi:hypothetical protein